MVGCAALTHPSTPIFADAQLAYLTFNFVRRESRFCRCFCCPEVREWSPISASPPSIAVSPRSVLLTLRSSSTRGNRSISGVPPPLRLPLPLGLNGSQGVPQGPTTCLFQPQLPGLVPRTSLACSNDPVRPPKVATTSVTPISPNPCPPIQSPIDSASRRTRFEPSSATSRATPPSTPASPRWDLVARRHPHAMRSTSGLVNAVAVGPPGPISVARSKARASTSANPTSTAGTSNQDDIRHGCSSTRELPPPLV